MTRDSLTISSRVSFFFPLYKRTGEEKYKKALDTLLPIIRDFPRNEAGGFWHKEWYPNQMWLDGLYMAGPISAEYAYRFEKPEYLDLAAEQALLMQEKTRDPKTGLWYHAWDCSKEAEWADPETGLAPEFWGRSIGWVPWQCLTSWILCPGSIRITRLCGCWYRICFWLC